VTSQTVGHPGDQVLARDGRVQEAGPAVGAEKVALVVVHEAVADEVGEGHVVRTELGAFAPLPHLGPQLGRRRVCGHQYLVPHSGEQLGEPPCAVRRVRQVGKLCVGVVRNTHDHRVTAHGSIAAPRHARWAHDAPPSHNAASCANLLGLAGAFGVVVRIELVRMNGGEMGGRPGRAAAHHGAEVAHVTLP
jgi:hypothetical protein